MKNLKLIKTVESILAVSALIMSCGNKAVATKTQETNAEESKEATKAKFVVGFDAEYPPYGYITDNGTYEGFDLDLATEFCDRVGMEFVKKLCKV